ncbi:MAG: tRNA 2-thiouridine(34) synthase MnmA [Candidatus Cloacimonas sp. 4484_209]|nr:MAG: tRNA 2-thiouridine(34) synthase MnmA [Candidatus Cloacimonas sp. 4484_209]
MKKRVILGMSGGLDSSVSAYLLIEKGFEVIGITMKFSGASRCCSEKDICDAKKVAQKLGFQHYTIDVTQLFSKKVIQYFIDSYTRGKTPNPCAVCNRKVKFQILFREAKELNAKFVATGHYARIKKIGNYHYLFRSLDIKKDQSYFLARLKRDWLSEILFPVGKYTKEKISKIASDADLPFYKKDESQEVCFISENNYRNFLSKKFLKLSKPGKIIDKSGKVLGEHKGIFYYTIGQRKGIQVDINIPLYVISINPEENTITVGEKGDVQKRFFIAEGINWLVYPNNIPTRVSVKIRSQHKAQTADINLKGTRAFITFDKPQMAITPGQLAVLYRDKMVLGSGWITE